MAKRNILKDEEPTLRKRSREVLNFDRRLHMLLDDMAETMEDADGAGLAAPQVGILRRVAIVVGLEGNIELINPVITASEGEESGPEGCLSFPGKWGIVVRPEKVTVTAQNRYGKTFTVSGDGIVARAFCHEIDHLDGVVFIDKAERLITEEELRAMHTTDDEEEQESN